MYVYMYCMPMNRVKLIKHVIVTSMSRFYANELVLNCQYVLINGTIYIL